MKTSKSGYLTRKLCDVSQDVITTMDDCGTVSGIYLKKTQNRRQNFTKRLTGRYLAEDITSGGTVYTRNTEVTESIAKALNDDENVTQVKVRSVLVCEAVEGVCCKCYGYDMSLQKPAHIGFAAGIVAGQVQGEASTQLTMDSKHGGAKVGGVDITQGLPRLEELFEVRTPKFKALIAEIDGIVRMANTKKRGIDVNVMRIENDEIIEKAYQLKEGDEVKFTRAKKVKKQEGLVDLADGKVLAAPIDGYVEKTEEGILFKGTRHIEVEYTLTSDMILRVQDGDTVIAGQQISEGSIDAKDLMRFGNLQKAEQYLIDNIQEVWGTQGISIDDKHIEVVVRKMAGFVRIVDAGDSLYIPGDVLPYRIVKFENLSLKEDGKRPAKFVRQLLGISTAAKEADGFLSAASFQEQVKVLSEAAIKGKVDYLKGLKENVIIGRLLPLGENSRILEDIVSSVEED